MTPPVKVSACLRAPAAQAAINGQRASTPDAVEQLSDALVCAAEGKASDARKVLGLQQHVLAQQVEAP